MKYLLAFLAFTLTAVAQTIPRLDQLILPDPFGDGRNLTRAHSELSGTGIGKYEYPDTPGYPIISVAYFLVDTTFGDRTVDPGETASSYIDSVISFKTAEDIERERPPLRDRIAGLDCLIADYPNQKRGDGYLLKQYIIEFYIPEHRRVYGIRFEAFWSEDETPYNHRFTPQNITKAVVDFVNHNK